MATMRIGVIGVGRAGRVHLDAWRAVEGADPVAVADPEPAVRRAARDAGLRAYADPADLIGREDLDAVSICTPPASHAEIAIACLARGLDVLCEKPLAVTVTEARRMLAAATRHGRRLLLATKFRHVPDLVQARALVTGGAIGEPLGFGIDFSSVVDMSRRWNSRPQVAGGGVVVDNGCHAFDIVGFLFGPVSRVHATRLKSVQRLSVEDSATILVAADGGLIGRVDLSWSHATERPAYIAIHGSLGSLEIGWRGSRLCRAGQPPEPIGDGYDRDDAHRRMLAAFRETVRGPGQPWISAEECLRTQAALQAAYRSMRTGGWATVDVPSLDDDDSFEEACA
jgi:predicted dehydrogenase